MNSCPKSAIPLLNRDANSVCFGLRSFGPTTELISGYRRIIHKHARPIAAYRMIYPQGEGTRISYPPTTTTTKANDATHYDRNMSESASLARYIEGTIPDWLIRGLGDLGGWSNAKLIRVVLPYLYASRQMMSVPFR